MIGWEKKEGRKLIFPPLSFCSFKILYHGILPKYLEEAKI
jgi:hypothetical protein